MNTSNRTTGKLVFGNGLRITTIDAIKSSRGDLDMIFPDRLIYMVHNKGKVYETQLELVGDKVKTLDDNMLWLVDTDMIYVVEDDSEVIEPLRKCMGTITKAVHDDPITINWRDGVINTVDVVEVGRAS